MPKAEAGRRVHLGRSLRHLPVAEAAWGNGDISGAHVSALARARTTATEAALARDEQYLVAEASELRHASFLRVLAYWSQHADPDGVEDQARRDHDERRFHLSRSFEGRWWGDLVLDPISGMVVSNALRRIEDELFADDWADARARVGDTAGPSDVARTPAQRRADALVEMARRAGAEPAGATRRAVEVRDQECFHEMCDLPAERCQIDHIEPWSAGGRTVSADGRPACAHHNRGRHLRRGPPLAS